MISRLRAWLRTLVTHSDTEPRIDLDESGVSVGGGGEVFPGPRDAYAQLQQGQRRRGEGGHAVEGACAPAHFVPSSSSSSGDSLYCRTRQDDTRWRSIRSPAPPGLLISWERACGTGVSQILPTMILFSTNLVGRELASRRVEKYFSTFSEINFYRVARWLAVNPSLQAFFKTQRNQQEFGIISWKNV